MPEISRFFGIIIAMFYDDHNPPHFHARYGKDGVAIEITSLRVLEGQIPAPSIRTCDGMGFAAPEGTAARLEFGEE